MSDDSDDILDHVWDHWCQLCSAHHLPCEISDEYGHDIGTPDPEPDDEPPTEAR